MRVESGLEIGVGGQLLMFASVGVAILLLITVIVILMRRGR
ncbi:hypothetical protein HDA32_005469 [Spinactinospora alkalitolerans]|uniref:Uncharacterized protein n=1 Tax=Spinactinospora alkalitolerans TaxID=687207 RepID=A0A852U2C5_9ACTN|nr:hypothetical protein [Spinactinospora alkalitolerans]NYE50349.1 hypothetical protein [Spinactinospora alkalitolerans]